MNFSTILAKTLAHEGFYANVQGDRGGETYRGVARNIFPNWEGWVYVDQYKAQRGGKLSWNERIPNATLDRLVHEFFYRQFWLKPKLDQVRDKQVATLIFDFHVNAGANAIKEVQKVLNNEFGKSLTVDGVSGNLTVAAINSVSSNSLFNKLNEYRIIYYKRIAQYGENAQFLTGWLRRASSFVYDNSNSFLALLAIGGLGYWYFF